MKKIFTAICAAGLLFSCAEKHITKEQVLPKGIQLYKEGKYDDAKDYLKEAIYKAENMTTTDIMQARYMLANIYYREENYIDAIVEFEEFLSLFPTAPQVPEVLYKLAVSYLKISPSPDRDLTYVRKALDKAEELKDEYPNSPYAKKADEIIKKAKKMEATHLIDIADLYEHLGKYYSAAVYYNMAYDDYTDFIDKEYVIYKIGYNLLNVDKQYEEEIQEYKQKIKELEEKIQQEKDIEKKNVLINRKELLQKHVDKLEDRIQKSKKRGITVLKHMLKEFPNTKYKDGIKDLLKNVKEG
ncbi:outer membrane protein assembly factor BamD [Persephonella sp.]|uniref:outer membrane protein assembly factor BamD n=1 Tax=Persephonella sp. TaxID=2060922 RepID=UPI00260A5FC0|nr:outer membrane protein assembly factor BamD [Persephonella sp.]